MSDVDKKCKWCFELDSYYETECGESFQFNDGGPLSNNFKHCPYCGLKIEAQKVLEIK